MFYQGAALVLQLLDKGVASEALDVLSWRCAKSQVVQHTSISEGSDIQIKFSNGILFHLDLTVARPFSPQCVLQNKGHLESALGLCKPRIRKQNIYLSTLKHKRHKRKLLLNLSSFFTAKILFEQVHAVQKQYFLGSIIHTGFLRGLRKILDACQWSIWQLQRITCIMTRLSKANPRHHSACSQENKKSTCAVEAIFQLEPSPQKLLAGLPVFTEEIAIFSKKKKTSLESPDFIDSLACSFGRRNCSLPCSHSRLRHALAISESVKSSQVIRQRYLFENLPWAYQALHYPGVQLQVSFEQTARTLLFFWYFHVSKAINKLPWATWKSNALKKFGDKPRLQFA